jgi:hypothetical protein
MYTWFIAGEVDDVRLFFKGQSSVALKVLEIAGCYVETAYV